MSSILIIAATYAELSLVVQEAGLAQRTDTGVFPVWSGEIGGREVIAAVSGMGKTNTAACAAVLLTQYQPRLLISTGCGGAFPGSGLNVGGLAIATREIYGDEGVLTPEGWQPLQLIRIPLVERDGERYFNEFPLSAKAGDRAAAFAEQLGYPVRRGPFVTVSTCSGTRARGEELVRRFNCICENMEGAAAAQVGLIYGVETLELRGVSNMVEDRDLSRWDIPLAVERAQRFLLSLVATW
jgi:futalosine hydrolase